MLSDRCVLRVVRHPVGESCSANFAARSYVDRSIQWASFLPAKSL